jgi:hypothetical protein
VVLLAICEAVLVPGLALLFGAPIISLTVVATIAVATLGMAVVGCLLAALAAQTRARELLLPVLALPLAWASGRPGRAVRLALVAGGCALLVLPWIVRNWTTFDRPVLVSTNDAWVLDGASCDRAWHGPEMGGWRFDCLERAASANEAADAAHRRSHALHYVGDHKARAPLVMTVRVLRTWDLWRPLPRAASEAKAERRNVTFERAGVAMYFVLLALAIVGARVLHRRGGPLPILLAPALVVTIASALGYGVTRFRVASEPTIVLLAALAAARLWERRRPRDRPPAPASAASVPR